MNGVVRRVLIVLLLLPIMNVSALSVSNNDLVIEKGTDKQIELYANTDESVSEVRFTLVYSNKEIVADFNVNDSFRDENPGGIRHTIDFPQEQKGKILLGTIHIKASFALDEVGVVNVYNAMAITSNNKEIGLNSTSVRVKIGVPEEKEEPSEVDPNLLDRINSDIVKIDLKDNVFDYDVAIDKEIDKLDLEPVCKDSRCEIDVSSQKIDELKDGSIVITAKLDDVVQKYKINVNIKDEDVLIDNGEFVEDNSYKKKWFIITIVLCCSMIFVSIIMKVMKKG